MADAETVAGWAVDQEFRRQAGWDPERTTAQVQTHLEHLVEDPPSNLLRLAVESEGLLVGYVDLRSAESGEYELGFLIGGRERWGQRLGTAAATAAVDHAFDVLDATRVTARVATDNERSLRVLQRLGFRRVGSVDPRPDEGWCRLRLTR